jgi:hypothetical protein
VFSTTFPSTKMAYFLAVLTDVLFLDGGAIAALASFHTQVRDTFLEPWSSSGFDQDMAILLTNVAPFLP